MASKVIKSFLVGIGLDTKDFDKGSKNVTTGLNRFRSVAGLAGAAMVGAMGTAGAAALSAGNRIDKLALSAERMSASAGFVYNFGNALRTLGGDSSEALAAVSSIDSALDELRLKGGFGAFNEAAFSGADINALSRAANAEEFLRISAEIVPTLNKQQQRLFQESFGFSDATMRSLREGSQRFDEMIHRASQLASGFDEAVLAAREYNKELSEFQHRLEGISNALAERMLPSFTGILESVNSFIDNNNKNINAAMDIASKSPTGAAVAAAGAGALGAGTAISGLGLKTAGRAVSRLGLPGLAVGTGMMAWETTPEDIENLTGYRPSDYIFENTPADAARDAWNWLINKTGGSGDYEAPVNIPQTTENTESYQYFNEGDISYPQTNENTYQYLNENTESYQYFNDSPINYQYITEGSVNNTEAAQAAPEYIIIQNQQTERDRKPVQQKIQNNLDIRMELDGRALENKIIDVSERREQAAIDDLQSTTVR